jgi:hypothetical protein
MSKENGRDSNPMGITQPVSFFIASRNRTNPADFPEFLFWENVVLQLPRLHHYAANILDSVMADRIIVADYDSSWPLSLADCQSSRQRGGGN